MRMGLKETVGINEPLEDCADLGGNAVIRQAISCDICGTEKKQTNHWFVAYDQGGELRVSGWNSRNRLRPGSRHLCGQTCLHKLVDDFMAKALAVRPQPNAVEEAEDVREMVAHTDASLTSNAAYEEVESSARLIPTPTPAVAKRPPQRAPVEVVTMPGRGLVEVPPPGVVSTSLSPAVSEDTPRFASRNWRAEAWEREREREMRAGERRTETVIRRRSNL
jgi:hypothetical protein